MTGYYKTFSPFMWGSYIPHILLFSFLLIQKDQTQVNGYLIILKHFFTTDLALYLRDFWFEKSRSEPHWYESFCFFLRSLRTYQYGCLMLSQCLLSLPPMSRYGNKPIENICVSKVTFSRQGCRRQYSTLHSCCKHLGWPKLGGHSNVSSYFPLKQPLGSTALFHYDKY